MFEEEAYHKAPDSLLKGRERSARVNKVIAERRLAIRFKTDLPGSLMVISGTLSPEDMRALANAMDGVDDWKDAMLLDLKQDCTAYQRGLEDGKVWFVEELNYWMEAVCGWNSGRWERASRCGRRPRRWTVEKRYENCWSEMSMTAPSDFLDLDRLADDGNPNHQRIEEHWDEPLCEMCQEKSREPTSDLCYGCLRVVDAFAEEMLSRWTG